MEKRLDWRWGVWGADDRAWLTSLHVRNKKLLHIDQTNACQQSTIPKIVHQIWLGPHPIPRQCIQWMKSWKTIHSDFEYVRLFIPYAYRSRYEALAFMA